MKIKINNPKANFVFLNGVEYKTNQFIELPFSEAIRLSRIMSVDMDSERIPYNPTIFSNEKKYAILADIDTVSGWGNVGLNLVRVSAKTYTPVLIGKILNVKDPYIIRAVNEPLDKGMGIILHEQPKSNWDLLPFEKKIAIVPWETTQCPPSWVPRINKCAALLVPCQQNVQAFKDSGVTIPIEVIHWGVDTTKFKPVERFPGRPFTFGSMGALSIRKGTDVLVQAFLRAFPTEQDVQLICKTSFNNFMFAARDKRVKVDMTPVDHDELMNNFFKKVDCFVFPTRGEGFGLTPLEAMATGIPAIVTNWSGPVEYMTDETGYKLDFSPAPATEFTKHVYREECGNWVDPNIEHLVHLMRHAYEHQDEVREKGQKAAKYVAENWTWEHKIQMFHNAIKKHL